MNVNVTMPRHQTSPDRYGGIRTIHAKIANRRKDFLRKESTRNTVASSSMSQPVRPIKTEMANTEMANGTLDASLADLKHMTSHQALTRGAFVVSQRGLHDPDLCSVRCAQWRQRYRRSWNKAGLGIRQVLD
jgi:hypothetical protein